MILLAAGAGAVVIDGARARADARLAGVVAVTRLPGAALSVRYCEPRCRPYADFSTVIHPELAAPAAQDFVYER